MEVIMVKTVKILVALSFIASVSNSYGMFLQATRSMALSRPHAIAIKASNNSSKVAMPYVAAAKPLALKAAFSNTMTLSGAQARFNHDMPKALMPKAQLHSNISRQQSSSSWAGWWAMLGLAGATVATQDSKEEPLEQVIEEVPVKSASIVSFEAVIEKIKKLDGTFIGELEMLIKANTLSDEQKREIYNQIGNLSNQYIYLPSLLALDLDTFNLDTLQNSISKLQVDQLYYLISQNSFLLEHIFLPHIFYSKAQGNGFDSFFYKSICDDSSLGFEVLAREAIKALQDIPKIKTINSGMLMRVIYNLYGIDDSYDFGNKIERGFFHQIKKIIKDPDAALKKELSKAINANLIDLCNSSAKYCLVRFMAHDTDCTEQLVEAIIQRNNEIDTNSFIHIIQPIVHPYNEQDGKYKNLADAFMRGAMHHFENLKETENGQRLILLLLSENEPFKSFFMDKIEEKIKNESLNIFLLDLLDTHISKPYEKISPNLYPQLMKIIIKSDHFKFMAHNYWQKVQFARNPEDEMHFLLSICKNSQAQTILIEYLINGLNQSINKPLNAEQIAYFDRMITFVTPFIDSRVSDEQIKQLNEIAFKKINDRHDFFRFSHFIKRMLNFSREIADLAMKYITVSWKSEAERKDILPYFIALKDSPMLTNEQRKQLEKLCSTHSADYYSFIACLEKKEYATQSQTHMYANRTALVDGDTAWFTRPFFDYKDVSWVKDEIFKKEDELRDRFYTFFHGQRKSYYLPERLHTLLWQTKEHLDCSDFLFAHIVPPVAEHDKDKEAALAKEIIETGRTYEFEVRRRLLFMNYGLFANAKNKGSSSACYALENCNAGNVRIELEDSFKHFDAMDIYHKYQKELQKLEKDYSTLGYGNLLMIAVPKQKIKDLVYLAVTGGGKSQVYYKDGNLAEGMDQIMEALCNEPEKLLETDTLEFCMPMTQKDGGLDPQTGIKVIPFVLGDKKRVEALKKREQELFDRIKADLTGKWQQ